MIPGEAQWTPLVKESQLSILGDQGGKSFPELGTREKRAALRLSPSGDLQEVLLSIYLSTKQNIQAHNLPEAGKELQEKIRANNAKHSPRSWKGTCFHQTRKTHDSRALNRILRKVSSE